MLGVCAVLGICRDFKTDMQPPVLDRFLSFDKNVSQLQADFAFSWTFLCSVAMEKERQKLWIPLNSNEEKIGTIFFCAQKGVDYRTCVIALLAVLSSENVPKHTTP